MPITPVLVNPTPWEIKIPYEKGIVILVPADGETLLEINQMDDFRPDKPGYEGVRELLIGNGVFLRNTDFSFDSQAFESLKELRAHKDMLVKGFIDTYRGNAAKMGATIQPEVMDEALRRSGLERVKEQIKVIDARIKVYEKSIADDPSKGRMSERLDPTRTCFATQPPRVFSSPTALNVFLSENPEIKAKHDQFVKALNNEAK